MKHSSPTLIDTNSMEIAVNAIKGGSLVAFPTETVYGLGADAFNAQAVERVYHAKGRPGDNPLILHVATISQFLQLIEAPQSYVLALAQAFWPGALTLVAKKAQIMPAWVGGHPNNTTSTIGVRIPSHPVALEFLRKVNAPIAAPSANKSGRPSPTSAQHVVDDFASTPEVGFVLQGDNSAIGIESTVIDVTGDMPVILRPGAITQEMVEDVISEKLESIIHLSKDEKPRSPGMKYRHYAPKAPVTILEGNMQSIVHYISNACVDNECIKIGVLAAADVNKCLAQCAYNNIILLDQGDSLSDVASKLFRQLREFDNLQVDKIYVQAVEDAGFGTAIMDRMRKAASGNIMKL